MPTHIERQWMPADGTGLSRRDKAGGTYEAYAPDKLRSPKWQVEPDIARFAAQVERKIVDIRQLPASGQLESIARLLMRSEAISSSKIEGIAPNVDKVVLAELAQREDVRGFKESAEAVARNLSVLRSVEESFSREDSITPELLERFQAELLGNTSIPTGIRTQQNWIGGSSWTPIGAEFVPPPPEYIPDLVEDLCEYLEGAHHGALIQAAIAHAQFETIHPFNDGNGRVGRALIHGTLLRRGLTQHTILPVSLVLGTWSSRYVAGLTAYRGGDVNAWLQLFLEAADIAVEQARILAQELQDIQSDWWQRIEQHRAAEGKTRALRNDSIEAKLLAGMASHPIITVTTVERLYGTKATNARKALDSLKAAGIVRAKVIGKGGVIGYYADDILNLITHEDRQLASSQFDTRLSPPGERAAPARRD